MVKEEDKGRGCVAVHWMDVFFSYGFKGLSRKCCYYPKELAQGKTKKIPDVRFF
jgi:hypothetical protein